MSLPFSTEFPVLIGPMVGISHVAFRELIRFFTPKDVPVSVFTEMLSTRKLPSEKINSCFEVRFSPNEQGFIPQLLGNEESFIAKSIGRLATVKPSGIDINMGCPVNHVLKHNWGVRLMENPDYAAGVVEATKRSTSLPVSVKIRAGLTQELNEQKLLEFVQRMESVGADWMTIHARSAEQKHSGPAHWDLVQRVASRVKIPLLINGDIQTREDVLHVLKNLGASGVVIGRAAVVRPWILWQSAFDLGLTTDIPPQTSAEESKMYFLACSKLVDFLEIYSDSELQLLEKFRFFSSIGSKWFDFGHAFWASTTKAKTIFELRSTIDQYVEIESYPMKPRIEH